MSRRVPRSRAGVLAAIKADGAFAELGLVRNGRLSVVPVPAAMWRRLEVMARRG